MDLYSHRNYRSALADIFARKKRETRGWSLRSLAETAGLQPSFVTNVMKERAHFSSDQLFAVCEQLGETKAARQYLLLLLEHERCAHRPRRAELAAEIANIRAKHRQTEEHISNRPVQLSADAMAEYYLDPFVSLVHIHLTLPPYDRDIDRLRPALGLSREHLKKIVALLSRLGYVRREGERYVVLAQNQHLATDNPLCDPYQALMRLKSVDQMQRLDRNQKYSFSATLSGNEETRAKLHEAFLDFLKVAESIVKPAEAKRAYQINFDLFGWEI